MGTASAVRWPQGWIDRTRHRREWCQCCRMTSNQVQRPMSPGPTRKHPSQFGRVVWIARLSSLPFDRVYTANQRLDCGSDLRSHEVRRTSSPPAPLLGVGLPGYHPPASCNVATTVPAAGRYGGGQPDSTFAASYIGRSPRCCSAGDMEMEQVPWPGSPAGPLPDRLCSSGDSSTSPARPAPPSFVWLGCLDVE
jgi:hypothetical protein